MTRLINADAFKKENERLLHCDFPYLSETTLEELIDEAPTVDAEPVRHGKWANDVMGVLRCSECNAQAPWRFIYGMYDMVDYRWKANYCPQCGARMDKDD